MIDKLISLMSGQFISFVVITIRKLNSTWQQGVKCNTFTLALVLNGQNQDPEKL